MHTLRYRPDIDGLRAVAVLAVVVYHLRPGHLAPGGFTGVDVFFVISGLLITGIISRESDEGSFRLVEFYRRRAQRILPALVLMLTVTSVAVSTLLFLPQVESYRSSLFATVFFSANLYFAKAGNYFAQPSTEQPLLHTWSLGVEEQFYLFFPLLVMVLTRYARRWLRPVVAVGTLASFGLSAVLVHSHPTATFYLLPTRAWELGVGSLLALGAVPAIQRGWVRQGAALGGAAAVAAGILLLHDTVPFPGPAALLPVLGAALVLHAGPESLVGRVLALPPARFVGKISYSLYLWHWPVLVIYKATHPGPLSRTAVVGLFATSVLVASVSWWVVETPLRRIRLPRRRQVAAFAATAMVLGFSQGFLLVPVAEARPQSAEVSRLLSLLDKPLGQRSGRCFIWSAYEAKDFRTDLCLGRGGPHPDLLLMGDSHAAALWPGLDYALPGFDVLQATASGCKPLLPLQGEGRCTGVMQRALDTLRSGPPVDTIVVTARWRPEDFARLPGTIAQLRRYARHVVVIGPTSEYTTALPMLLARGLVSGDEALAAHNLVTSRFDVDAAMARLVPTLGADYVSQLALLCPHRVCREYAPDGTPMKFDYGHLTESGSRYVGQLLAPTLLAIHRR